MGARCLHTGRQPTPAPFPAWHLRQSMPPHGQSAAAPVPSVCCPLGGSEVKQGAASVRARCRADGGQEWRLAAQPCAGAVQRRRGISRCTDRSAGGCADWRTFSTTHARACGGLDAAEASPRRCAPWRSRARRWRGPRGPFDRKTLPLAAVGAAARSRRRAGPGWHRRRRPWARRGSALRTATDPRRRGGCRAGERAPRVGGLLPRGMLDILSGLRSPRRPHRTRGVRAIARPLRRTRALSLPSLVRRPLHLPCLARPCVWVLDLVPGRDYTPSWRVAPRA